MNNKCPPILRLVRIVSKSRSQLATAVRYNLQISCHVKPNASSQREGIASVGDDRVEVCVSAQPREGEANLAVTRIFAKVFNVPKSTVEVLRGGKSRDKTLCITDLQLGKGEDEESFLRKARELLHAAVDGDGGRK